MYKVIRAFIIEAKHKVEIPAYTTNPSALKKELKKNSQAKEVTIKCEEMQRDYEQFNRLKNSYKKLEESGIPVKERVWASNYADSFDFATLQEKKALLHLFVEAVKWGQ